MSPWSQTAVVSQGRKSMYLQIYLCVRLPTSNVQFRRLQKLGAILNLYVFLVLFLFLVLLQNVKVSPKCYLPYILWRSRSHFYGKTMRSWNLHIPFKIPLLHSSKILTIQQGIPRGVSSIGNPRGPLTGFNSGSVAEESSND